MTAGVLAATLAGLFYGITPVCARRAIRLLGFVRANLARLVVATVAMGALSLVLGRATSGWYLDFALAGAIGFGVGGIAMFRALPLLGAPLASLLVETTAALTAGVLAWVWFGDALTGGEVVLALVILTGVVLGLLPYVRATARAAHPVGVGVAFAVLAAVAQAVSGVLSRRALIGIQRSRADSTGAVGSPPVSGRFDVVSSAAFDRLTGGVAIAFLALLLVRWAARTRPGARAALEPARDLSGPDLGWLGNRLPDRAWFWVGANSLLGPVLGVTAMVWALQSMQPGLVQSVAAIAPLIAIPFARWLEGYRPPPRYWVGALVAAGGLAGLALAG
ncbi:DMT family transporter [Intrasporangium sp.]|uniref:DMT family transporter n=1 Tax=Intrasporangium sp. TaxID=1925024 RepID=UPI002939A974|nr:DMT family transporter [Intrasporangium sp.]MDV3221118.1 DMT family transporter [Intrasporangium sp.]